MRRAPLLAAACLLLNACGDSGDSDAEFTWHGGVRQALENNCGSCHNAGGVAPFSVYAFDDVRVWAPAIAREIEAGTMPPWPADPDCRHYEHERVLSDADRAAILRFVELGAPEGRATGEAPAPAQSEQSLEDLLGAPDDEGRPDDLYMPDIELEDDYRCFILDIDADEERWLQAIEIVPDNMSTVHHILVFRVGASVIDGLHDLDALSERPGYTCFGGPGVASDQNLLAGWAPGSIDRALPDNMGQRIDAGSALVMQVHYHLDTWDGRPDNTGFKVYFHDEKPELEFEVVQAVHLGIRVPAGETGFEQTVEIPNFTGGTYSMLSVSPHMHTLGKSLRIDKIAADGSSECIVDVPEWDFDWQGFYAMREDEVPQVAPTDVLRMTCTYDNDAPDAKLVTWGEGTDDEMCYAPLGIIREVPAEHHVGGGGVQQAGACDGLEECLGACPNAQDFECTNRCLSQQSGDCGTCFFRAQLACGQATCEPQTESFSHCFAGCVLSSVDDIGNCIGASCGLDFVGFNNCVAPKVQEGACNAELVGCGLEF